ncbi:hypothetical protein [Leptolinea tardivitalis]|nr:hypothetical protein [Leptolinea tardivitalis]
MSIVQSIIHGFIGDFGMKVGDLYYANSLWINGIILFYALIVYISWRNYERVHEVIISSILEQLEPKLKNWSKSEITRNLKSVSIPWDKARKTIKIPLLAKSGTFLPKFASMGTIMALFPSDVLIQILREKKKN